MKFLLVSFLILFGAIHTTLAVDVLDLKQRVKRASLAQDVRTLFEAITEIEVRPERLSGHNGVHYTIRTLCRELNSKIFLLSSLFPTGNSQNSLLRISDGLSSIIGDTGPRIGWRTTVENANEKLATYFNLFERDVWAPALQSLQAGGRDINRLLAADPDGSGEPIKKFLEADLAELNGQIVALAAKYQEELKRYEKWKKATALRKARLREQAEAAKQSLGWADVILHTLTQHFAHPDFMFINQSPAEQSPNPTELYSVELAVIKALADCADVDKLAGIPKRILMKAVRNGLSSYTAVLTLEFYDTYAPTLAFPIGSFDFSFTSGRMERPDRFSSRVKDQLDRQPEDVIPTYFSRVIRRFQESRAEFRAKILGNPQALARICEQAIKAHGALAVPVNLVPPAAAIHPSPSDPE